ncbi:MAG: TFIIB-type zinc ribbon-containing protein [Saccharolobus sp.]
MKCQVCGSTEIVWNEEKGEIVCSNCGVVIDSIYYDSVDRFSVNEIVIDNNLYFNDIKIKNLRIREFFNNNTLNKSIDEYEIILKTMLLDKQYRIIYDLLLNEGILSGIRTKTKVGILIYIRYVYNNKYREILKKLKIDYKLIKNTIRKLGSHQFMLLLDKINEELDES